MIALKHFRWTYVVIPYRRITQLSGKDRGWSEQQQLIVLRH